MNYNPDPHMGGRFGPPHNPHHDQVNGSAAPGPNGDSAQNLSLFTNSDYHDDPQFAPHGEVVRVPLLKTAADLKMRLGNDPSPEDVDAAMRILRKKVPGLWVLFHGIPPQSLFALLAEFTRSSSTTSLLPATLVNRVMRDHTRIDN